MRRFAIVALAVTALAAAPAATEAQVTFGGQVAYHEDADLGVGAIVGVPLPALHENVRIMGDFTYFFPDNLDYWELNGNLAYDFAMAESGIVPFAFAGLNYADISVDVSDEFEDTFGDAGTSEIGLNLGGGITFDAESITPSVGAKVELSGGEGFVIFGSIGFGG